MTKSELFTAAHKEAKNDIESGIHTNYKEAFADNLKGMYLTYRLEAKESKKAPSLTIQSAKKSFWDAWNTVKASKFSTAPGSRQRANVIFESACEKIRSFSEQEIRSAFGKYSDFAISKAF